MEVGNDSDNDGHRIHYNIHFKYNTIQHERMKFKVHLPEPDIQIVCWSSFQGIH
jgi:hypothetical protein